MARNPHATAEIGTPMTAAIAINPRYRRLRRTATGSAADGIRPLSRVVIAPRAASARRSARYLLSHCLAPTAGQQRPDDEDVDGDHDDRPQRVIRDEHEAGNGAEAGQDGAEYASPEHAQQDADACGEEH